MAAALNVAPGEGRVKLVCATNQSTLRKSADPPGARTQFDTVKAHMFLADAL